jgi:hypothetical protein
MAWVSVVRCAKRAMLARISSAVLVQTKGLGSGRPALNSYLSEMAPALAA